MIGVGEKRENCIKNTKKSSFCVNYFKDIKVCIQHNDNISINRL